MDRFTFDDLYVRRLKEHDRETGEHFVAYFSPLIEAKLRARRVPAQDVEDVRQDVLLRTLAKLDGLRESCKLPSFLLGICDNILLERPRKVRPTEPLDDWILQIIGDWNIEEEVLKKEAAATVRQTLSEMGDSRDAKILRAIFIDDTDRDEVCRQFNISPENLSVILHRAKEKFRALLRKKKR